MTITVLTTATLVGLGITGGIVGTAGAEPPECISVEKQVIRGAVGYNHVVRLASTCETAMKCRVRTSANKEGVSATVPAKKSVEVSLFLASPASSFTADVNCSPAS